MLKAKELAALKELRAKLAELLKLMEEAGAGESSEKVAKVATAVEQLKGCLASFDPAAAIALAREHPHTIGGR